MAFDLAKFIQKSTKASGVPAKIKDKATLRRIAQMAK
jgi:hypothetical protein